MKATMQHARQLEYCSSGIRDFCKAYNLDFMTLVTEGFDCEMLRETGDALALSMVALAEKEASENG